MNREQQEMAIWREAYTLAISQGASYGDADSAATTVAKSFRERYPAEPAFDDRIGRAAIEAMDAIIEVMGDENASNQRKALAIDRIATQYVAARWHIQKETGK